MSLSEAEWESLGYDEIQSDGTIKRVKKKKRWYD
tara:strand:+ start:490 stop:591 length:102 start_codon:yes stop_codon:yes gene_type:complete